MAFGEGFCGGMGEAGAVMNNPLGLGVYVHWWSNFDDVFNVWRRGECTTTHGRSIKSWSSGKPESCCVREKERLLCVGALPMKYCVCNQSSYTSITSHMHSTHTCLYCGRADAQFEVDSGDEQDASQAGVCLWFGGVRLDNHRLQILLFKTYYPTL